MTVSLASRRPSVAPAGRAGRPSGSSPYAPPLQVAPLTILRLFVFARRRHLKIAPAKLETVLRLKARAVVNFESGKRITKRDRFVLAAWCGIEDMKGLA